MNEVKKKIFNINLKDQMHAYIYIYFLLLFIVIYSYFLLLSTCDNCM